MTRLGTLDIELWSNSVWQGGLAANNSDIDGGGIGEADILEQQRNSTNKNREVIVALIYSFIIGNEAKSLPQTWHTVWNNGDGFQYKY